MQEIGNKLKFVPGQNRGRYPFCHSLYLDGDVKVMVDPAADGELIKKIAGESGVDVVLLTHFHEDHWTFRHLIPDADVYIHADEAAPMESVESLFNYYGMEMDSPEGKMFIEQLDNLFKFTPKTPDRLLKNGDVLEFGSTSVEVIFTPGHSAGHCSFYFREQDVLYLGDYDLTRFGPWYGDKLSDIDQFIASAQILKNHPARIKVSAHDVGVVEGDIDEMWAKYLAVIDRRQSQLEEALEEKPRTMAEIIELGLIYGRLRKNHEWMDMGERANIGKHLDRMVKKGTATLDDGRYCLT